ncbi:MAG: GNAT family N-acetyltransferase [Candidatus Eiseniibacteriota bacterium]
MRFRLEPADATGAVELVATHDGAIRARATLYEAPDLVGAPGPSGLVGAYAADDTGAGRLLLEEACRHFADRGARRVLGPMDGSTWHAYRLVLPPGEQPDPPGGIAWSSFPGEPVNPPDAADAWRAAGLSIVARYESSVVLDLAAVAHAPPGPPEGVRLRPLALENFDEELDVLFAVSRRGFAQNPYYAPIGRTEFRSLYLPLRPLVDPAFVEIAEDDTGHLLGFLLCYAWPGATVGSRPVLIAKTIAVVPEARGRGLGGLLFVRAHARALERGYGAVVHALMHVANVSTHFSADQKARPFRRYALFGRIL